MRPVTQTILTKEEGGNCFAACLASILEVPLDVVPNAAAVWREPDEDAGERGWQLVLDWLAAYGVAIIQYKAADLDGWRPDGYWIGSFPSPRLPGETHAVVMHGQDLAWDPHPSAAKQPVDLDDPRFVDVFYLLDPVQLARALGSPAAVTAEAVSPTERAEASGV